MEILIKSKDFINMQSEIKYNSLKYKLKVIIADDNTLFFHRLRKRATFFCCCFGNN